MDSPSSASSYPSSPSSLPSDCSPQTEKSVEFEKQDRWEKYPNFRRTLDSKLSNIISRYGTSVYETNDRFERIYPEFDGSSMQCTILASEIKKQEHLDEVNNRTKYAKFYERKEKEHQQKPKEQIRKELIEAIEKKIATEKMESLRLNDVVVKRCILPDPPRELFDCWALDGARFVPPAAPMALGTKTVHYSDVTELRYVLRTRNTTLMSRFRRMLPNVLKDLPGFKKNLDIPQ